MRGTAPAASAARSSSLRSRGSELTGLYRLPHLLRHLPFLPTAFALVLAWGAFQLGWGETIQVTEGLGFYYGRRYGEIAQDFPRQVFTEGLDAFRLQRVLPSGVVYLALRGLGVRRDPQHVRDAFQLLNLACLLTTVVAWHGITRRVGIAEPGAWLGFCLLFLNVANLKMPYYIAVLTDTSALALGALLVYFHVSSNAVGMLAVLLLAAFTWPPLFLFGSFLFAFPSAPLPDKDDGRGRSRVAVAAALLFCGLLVFYRDALSRELLSLTLVILLGYVFGVARGLSSNPALFERATYFGGLARRRAACVAAVFVVIQLGIHAASTAPGMTLPRHLRNLVLWVTARPGIFFVGHVVYFGLVAVLLLALWPVVPRALFRFGLGMTLYVGALFAHSVNCESRQLIEGLPAYVLLAVSAAEAVRWPRWATWVVAGLGLAGSKVWLSINQGVFGSPFEYPAQLFYMNHGPSMTDATYGIQGGIVVLLMLSALASRRRLLGR